MPRNTREGAAATARDRVLSGALSEAYERRKKEAKLSLRALGEQVGVSHATLSRWFNGLAVPDYEDVVSILTALGVVGEEKDRIIEMARNPGPNWVATGPPGVSKELAGVMALEGTAERMTVWMPLFIPGILQTRNYARAIAVASQQVPTSDAEIDHLVTLRLGRQNAITRANPIQLHAYIGEPAITGLIGGQAVMDEQLTYLLRASEFDAVTIQLVDVQGDWHLGLIGSFVRYDFPGAQSIVYLEHRGSGTFLDNEADVEAYQPVASDLDRIARSPAETRAAIREVLRREKT